MSNEVFWAHITEKIALQVAAKRDQVNLDIPLPWNPTPTPPAT
jgi:hypothetical protein